MKGIIILIAFVLCASLVMGVNESYQKLGNGLTNVCVFVDGSCIGCRIVDTASVDSVGEKIVSTHASQQILVVEIPVKSYGCVFARKECPGGLSNPNWMGFSSRCYLNVEKNSWSNCVVGWK